MTPLPPADCRFRTTVLSPTIPSFRQPRAHCRAAVQDAPALPGYAVFGVLGRGGMAIVYKARQLGTKRLVAVKVIDSSLAGYEEIVARFRQEQALGARLRHPNLIAVYQAGRAAGCPYLVMELVEGDSLAGPQRTSAGGGEGSGGPAVVAQQSAQPLLAHHAPWVRPAGTSLLTTAEIEFPLQTFPARLTIGRRFQEFAPGRH